MDGMIIRGTIADALLFPYRRAEHIMAMPATQRRWTAGEVPQLIADSPLQTPRYELVNGERLVTPSPTWAHQRAVALLWKALDDYLERHPVGVACIKPTDAEIEPGSLVQPDVFVVPPHESQRMLTGALPVREMVMEAEALSPSSGRHDRVTKRQLYGRHLQEYWVVDLDARLFERWQLHGEQPEILISTLEWHPAGATRSFHVDLPEYFGRVFGEASSS